MPQKHTACVKYIDWFSACTSQFVALSVSMIDVCAKRWLKTQFANANTDVSCFRLCVCRAPSTPISRKWTLRWSKWCIAKRRATRFWTASSTSSTAISCLWRLSSRLRAFTWTRHRVCESHMAAASVTATATWTCRNSIGRSTFRATTSTGSNSCCFVLSLVPVMIRYAVLCCSSRNPVLFLNNTVFHKAIPSCYSPLTYSGVWP